jgi:hypothetical protein
MQPRKPAQLAVQRDNATHPDPPYARRVAEHAWHRTKELASVELIASTAVGIIVAGITAGFSWSGALYGAASFVTILVLAFIIHLLLSPGDLDKKAHEEIARLNDVVSELTKNKVIFEVSTMIRNSTVLLTDLGDAEHWQDAIAFHLETKFIIRFYNDDPEAVRIYGFRLAVINEVTGKEWPLTLHIMPPNFRRPDSAVNEYFQGLVVRGKEMTDWYFFQYWLDVPKDCAVSVDKNCFLRISMDAGTQTTYSVDLSVAWKAAREREVNVHNRNSEGEINCL